MEPINCKNGTRRPTNRDLTLKIVHLHEQGYELDFLLTNKTGLCCAQDGSCHHLDQAKVTLVDLFFDVLTKSYKYLHTVESGTGYKGLMLLDQIGYLH